MKVFAINGSPRKAQGKTAKILTPFLDRLREQGAEIAMHYASSMTLKPCSCGRMLCWNRTPGECIHKDDMQAVLPVLKDSQIWVMATPIYIPLPGEMQNFLNRLCPLLDPQLTFQQGRTRARLRDDVKVEKIVLVTTGGWWERSNVDTVERMQGQEREIVLVSLTTSNPAFASQLGEFFFQPQRLNVAVTRPRTKLIILGSIHLLEAISTDLDVSQSISTFKDLISSCKHINISDI